MFHEGAISGVLRRGRIFANGDTNANGYGRGITAESPTIFIALRGLQCLFGLENNHCTKSMK